MLMTADSNIQKNPKSNGTQKTKNQNRELKAYVQPRFKLVATFGRGRLLS